MKIVKKILFMTLLLVVPAMTSAATSKKIIINEFLAANSTGLADEDGEYSDWIELYNPGNTDISLNGWSLTDTKSKPTKWVLPNVTLGAKKYLVVFASSKDRKNPGSQLHTNFSLSKDGEYLGVIEPNGTVSDEYTPTFPPQETDVSYGYYQGELSFFDVPSPGAENTLETKAGKPVFSVERGYFSAPLSVSLTPSKPDTKIYYTTDGTRPTEQSTLYAAPVSITKTTPLSAVGVKDGKYSAVVTNTYFFVSDIVTQSNNPAGYPARWGYLGSDIKYDNYAVGERAPADYAMDANVCNNPTYKNQINDAFLAIPSVSIVANPDFLFSESTDPNTGGIYIHTGVTLGDGWERPVSIEYYDPSTGKQFQINCGLQLHGAASRQPEKTGKHSFRAAFRKEYGEGKLNFNLFENDKAVKQFDGLVFRAGFNLSWLHAESSQRTNTQYLNDSFTKRTQLNMGHVSAQDRFAHLFINGLYWGVYDISERVGDKFVAAYFGGEDVDYDVVNHDGLADGDITAYQRMVDLGKAGNYEQMRTEQLMAAENFIDYMLLNFYIGNLDWPQNNWYAARNRLEPGDGFRFFCWDAETSLTDVNLNRITGITGDFRQILFGSSTGFSSSGGGLYNNPEFQLLFADRVQKHFFNGGQLTPEKTAQLFQKIAGEIDLPIILESARWGDYRKNTLTPKGQSPPLYTRNDHWLPRKESLLRNYFPKRSDIVYNQLKSLGLTSPIDPPVLSSYGGSVDNPVNLSITANSGTVYYTTNGTDPRVSGGNISGTASVYNAPLQITGACVVKARVKNGQVWSALSEATFTAGGASGVDGLERHSVQFYYANNAAWVTLPESGNIGVEIYSVGGACVWKSTATAQAGPNRFELPGIPSGVYIYKLSFAGKSYPGKFIK